MRLGLLVFVAASSVACSGGQVQYDNSDSSGLADFRFYVDGAESVLFTAEAVDNELVLIYRVFDPDGRLVFDAADTWQSSESRTSAGFPSDAASLNWPISPTDPDIEHGWWDIEVGTGTYGSDDYFYFDGGIDVKFSTLVKQDDSLSSGSLIASIVYNGAMASDNELVSAMETAEAHWEEIYDGVGIDVDFEYWEYDGDDELAAPSFGDAAIYEDIATSTSERSINVVLTESIDNGATLYGVAGGIPGPLVPTGSSGVVVSATTHAGANGVFSAYEKELLGETIAHEVGHYLGLFHPVEISLDSWDALQDTARCNTQNECENQLGDNLMFPYPVYDAISGSYESQDQLTEDQAAVQNRYTAVD